MGLRAQHSNCFCLLQVEDSRIDAAGAIAFKEAVRQASEGGQDDVLLDLGAVDFIDSSGLGAVVAVMKALGPDRRLHLAGLRPAVAKVFRLTRMDSVFTIHATVADALKDAA